MNTILIRQSVFDVTSVQVTCSAEGKICLCGWKMCL